MTAREHSDETPHPSGPASAGPDCPRCGATMVTADGDDGAEGWRCTSCGLEMAGRR